MRTFRQYIEANMAAAPSMGAPAPPAPSSSDDKGHDDLGVMGRELDISPEDLATAIKDTPTIAFSPIHRKGQRRGSGPQIVFADKVNKSGSVDGRLMQGNMQKLQNPNGSRSYSKDDTENINFRGLNRKDASYTYPNAWLEPFKQAPGAMGGAPGMPPGALPPPPGSMPGMGGM